MLAHTNTTRNVSVRACARVRACVTEMERERETCAHFEDCSFFLLFFLYVTRERGHFFLLWFPPLLSKNTAKSSLFFLPFFFCLFSVLPFYFLISRCCPYKKNHHSRRRRKGSFFVVVLFFFFCVCVFSCLSQQQHKRGIAKYLCAKAKKATLFFLGFAQKARKKKRFKKNESNVTCSSLSFFFEE